MQNRLKILFTLIGIVSLFKIIQSYGFSIVQDEIHRSGYLLLLLALTFIPTLFCYALSWLLATNHKRMSGQMNYLKKIILFIKFTSISIAWNNLTPFLKVGGEPLKYMMLTRYLTKQDAIKSTINYNIIHLLSTVLSFIIGAIILCSLYQLPAVMKYACYGFILIFLCIIYIISKAMQARFNFFVKYYRWQKLRTTVVNSKVIMRRLTRFYKKHPKIFFLSIFFDTIARFIEGLTFFFGFMIIKHPISLLSASILDVARTLVDTIFFFIPYQVGSREQGVHYFMEKVLVIDTHGFLTAVLFYRFVEIVWIIIGYLFWVSMSKSSKLDRL